MKTIRELSESLRISKEAIYKKVNYSLKIELKAHVFKKDGKTYIDEVGENLIAHSLRHEQDVEADTADITSVNKTEQDLIAHRTSNEPTNKPEEQVINADFINVLKHQLTAKDKQIEALMDFRDNQLKNKDEQIEQLLKLNHSLIDTIQNEQKLKAAVTFLTDKKVVVAPDGETVQQSKKSFWADLFKKQKISRYFLS